MSRIDLIENSFRLSKEGLNNIQLDIIKELVTSNVLAENDDHYDINVVDFYFLDSFYQRTLGFPSIFEGYIKVLFNDIGGITHKDSSLRVEFYSEVNSSGDGHKLDLTQEGIFIKYQSDDIELLPENVTELLLSIDEYNSCEDRSSNNKGYELISNIQDYASESNIILDSFLDKQSIISPEMLILDVQVHDDEDKIVIKPKIEGDENEWFTDKALRSKRVKTKLTNVSDGVTSRVIFGEQNEEVLDIIEDLKIKGEYEGEEVKSLLSNPSDYFNPDLIDFSDLLSERVLGMQVFAPPCIPSAIQFKNEWIPAFKIDDETFITVKDEFEYKRLKDSYEFALSEDSKLVYYKGRRFKISTVRSVLNVSKIIFEEKEGVTEERLEEELKEGLIVKDNVEELLHVENTNLDNLDSFDLYKITNLRNGFDLKDHQKEGVSFLQSTYFKNVSSGVLLADDMGLGKTLQILYFLESIAQNKDSIKPVLIVCPSSLMENWKEEYSKFFESYNYDLSITVGGSAKQLSDLVDVENRNIPLVLTTYETLRINSLTFNTISWECVILDEAQKIKNPNALVTHSIKGLNSEFKIAMTGTPVENSLNDLWCIMDFCVPGILGTMKDFNRKLKVVDYDPRSDIEHFFIRRLKSDVAKDLPQKLEQRIETKMEGSQYELYSTALRQLQQLQDSELLKGSSVLRGIQELRNIVDHPLLITEEMDYDSEELYNSAKLRTTFEVLRRIKNDDEKAIIFTEKRKMQYILKSAIRKEFNIDVNIVNGDVPSTSDENSTKLSRQKLVDNFQAVTGFNVIIMSPIAAGFGLNVTEANHVIHYTRHWNPAKEQQATDRAYRIGQEKDVNVYYPISILDQHVSSFDQIIDQILERKKKLSDDVMFPTEKIDISKEEIIKEMNLLEI